MEKNMKKRPHDFLWRGSQMESKLMPGKEVTQQRTHNSKTFDLGRGAYQTVIYPETVHFKDAEGQWKEIDNRLEEARNEQGEAILRNQSNVLTMEFAKQTGKAPLVCVSNKKGQKIAWNIQNQNEHVEAKPICENCCDTGDEDACRADLSHVETELHYKEILPNVNVVCRMQGMMFKDDIVMENPQAQHRFVLEMDTQNVQLVKQEEGTIVAYAEGNPAEVAFVLPAAFMRDAEGNIGTVETDLVEENGKIQVALNCDEDFLQNAVYPVVVDPLIQTEEQATSIENQVEHYRKKIQGIPAWTFVGEYVDNGISGTSVKARVQFNKMIEDAENGKFDLIVTKAVSRFARNTLDSLMYSRKLLEVGVGIWFDTDGILNLDKDGELRLSIFSALAQDESAKKSEAVRFGQQEAIKRGTVFGFDNMFGFRKRDGKLEIDESEAPAIRKLFELYATDQYSMKQIEKILYNDGFRNHNGNKLSHATMAHIIRNPKYKGYFCGKKVGTEDMFTKKMVFKPESEWVMFKDERIVPAI